MYKVLHNRSRIETAVFSSAHLWRPVASVIAQLCHISFYTRMTTYFNAKSPVFSVVARPSDHPDGETILVSAGGGSAKTGIKNMLVRT